MRRLVALIIIVVVLAGGWTAGWFWFAGLVERNADSVFTEIARRGVEIDCHDRGVIGFPFAVRLACTRTDIAEQTTGTTASLGTVTGGASVFAPTTARLDMESPAHVASRLLESPTEVTWRNAAIDIGIGLNGPRDVSFDAADFSTALALPNLPDPGVFAARAAGTLAPSDQGGTNARFAFTDLRVSADGAMFPPVSGTASGHLSVPPRALLAGRAGIAAPVTARDIDIRLNSGEARFNAHGEISVDANGILDGSITLTIAGTEALPTFIAALPPQLQMHGNAIVGAIFALGRPTEMDGEPASELTVQITRGEARIGVLEFGLPRLPI